MRLKTILTGGVCVFALLISGCSSSPSSSANSGTVNGGTFTMAFVPDQTSLNPNAQNGRGDVSNMSYEQLVYIDDQGNIVPWVAQSWTVGTKTATFIIKPGITCQDGTPFTASDVAANINYVANPKNQSALNGVAVLAGTKATADNATRAVTVTAPTAEPFLLYGLSLVWMVCPKGLAHPAMLNNTTAGTGMYYLSNVSVGNEYTFTKRTNYTWGPYGETSRDPGLPDKVILKVVTDPTTAANLLLARQVNAAVITGPDQARVAAKGYFTSTVDAIAGQLWFHQGGGRPFSDVTVRRALTEALNLTQIRDVLTDNQGQPPTNVWQYPPNLCNAHTIAGNLPAYSPSQASALLASDGWKKGADGILTKNGQQLTVDFVFITSPEANAAAELIQQQWTSLGVKVTLAGGTEAQVRSARYVTGKWDAMLENLGDPAPDVSIPFVSGALPPKGVNFAAIDNATYNSLVTQAESLSPQAGCPLWNQAEVALLKAVDVVPFASQRQVLYSNGATFKGYGFVLPPSLSLTGG